MRRTRSALAALAACLVTSGGLAGCKRATLGRADGAIGPFTGEGGGAMDGGSSAGGTGGGPGGSAGMGGRGGFGGDVGGTSGTGPSAGAGGLGGTIGGAGRGGTIGGAGRGGTIGGAGRGGVGVGGAGVGGRGGSGPITCPSPPPPPAPVCGSSLCGNGMRDTCPPVVGPVCPFQATEECDGADFGGDSCAARGYAGGTLRCSGVCTIDASGCSACGPGVTCATTPVTFPVVVRFAIAATDTEIGLVQIDHDVYDYAPRLSLARLTPTFALVQAIILEGPVRVGGDYMQQAAVAPIAAGWVVAVCGTAEVYAYVVDASGLVVARTSVAGTSDPNQSACLGDTLRLAARPGGGALVVWQAGNGHAMAALIGADGLGATTAREIVGEETLAWEASGAAWVGDAFVVAVTVKRADHQGFGLRLVRIALDGGVTSLGELGPDGLVGLPTVVDGAADARLIYISSPFGREPYSNNIVVWQRLGLANGLPGPAERLGLPPGYYGRSPAFAIGNDAIVLVTGGGPYTQFGVIRVGLDGQTVKPLYDIVAAPNLPPSTFYDMVRRGPEAVVGWLTYGGGSVNLARVLP